MEKDNAILQNWMNNWNSLIKDWNSSPDDFYSKDIFLKIYTGKGNKELVKDALLEPYIGNPYKNSCVILNLNPGSVMEKQQDINTGEFITKGKAVENYQEFSKPFPYLSEFKDNGGGSWWNSRNAWLKRLIKNTKGIDTTENPFALEICYWHSKGWDGIELYKGETIDYLENLLHIAEEANKYSDLGIVVSVGKIYTKIFELLRFERILMIDKEDHNNIDFPKNGNGKFSDRTFSLYKSPNGVFFYNTWHTGGNKQPAKQWDEVEKYVMSQLSNK